jgi:hypothetical protein
VAKDSCDSNCRIAQQPAAAAQVGMASKPLRFCEYSYVEASLLGLLLLAVLLQESPPTSTLQ